MRGMHPGLESLAMIKWFETSILNLNYFGGDFGCPQLFVILPQVGCAMFTVRLLGYRARYILPSAL